MNRVRRPSYTDRILVSKFERNLQILKYSAVNDVKLSDHRPVFADVILYKKDDSRKLSSNIVIIILFSFPPCISSRFRI